MLSAIVLTLLLGCGLSDEAAIIGKYHADLDVSQAIKGTEKLDPSTANSERVLLDFSRAMTSMTVLKINEDNSCQLTTPGYQTSGTWTMKDRRIKMDFSGEVIHGKLIEDGKRIVIFGTGGFPAAEQGTLYFVRARRQD